MAEFSRPKASNPHNFTAETADPRMGGKVTETIHLTPLLEESVPFKDEHRLRMNNLKETNALSNKLPKSFFTV